MKKLKIKFLLALTILSSLFVFSLTATAAIDCNSPANAKEQIQCGTCDAAGTTNNCTPAAAPGTLQDTIRTVIEVLSLVAGAVAVIMIILGGFRFVTSAGNAETTKTARNTILYAVIGLVIIAMAQIIVHFTLNTVTCTSGKTASRQKC